MKTRFFSVLTVLLLAGFSCFAGVNEVKDVAPAQSAARFLQQEIRYPIVAREQNIEGTVYVTLKKVGEDKVQLETLPLSNEMLSRGVISQIEKLEARLAGLLESDEPQTVKFTFKSVR